jgi:hypothetical protein
MSAATLRAIQYSKDSLGDPELLTPGGGCIQVHRNKFESMAGLYTFES